MALIDQELLDLSLERADKEKPKLFKANIPKTVADTKPNERKSAISRALTELNVEFAYERTIGKNDSVYSNYAELLVSAKRKVGRIVIRNGNVIAGYATAFIVSRNLVLTNWHVFKTKEMAADALIEFDYEIDERANPKQAIVFKVRADKFYHSLKRLDYCFVAVDEMDQSGKLKFADLGCFYLDPALGKVMDKEYLSVIHHPGGDYKQLGIRENQLKEKLDDVLRYETDTAQGSSGCPVLNDQFQVVALHHGGVPVKMPNGGYLAKNNKDVIFPDANGQLDDNELHWESNEGIRISVILNDLFATFPDNTYVEGLKKNHDADEFIREKELIDEKPDRIIEDSKQNPDTMTNEHDVKISIPASLFERSAHVQVSINLNGTAALRADEEKEIVGLEKIEPDKNYDNRKGYDPDFLGTVIPFPKLSKLLLKAVSRIIGNPQEYILKYHHFSTVNHAIRGMPVVTAVNIDGKLDGGVKRKDAPNESDKWFYDPRILKDEQTANWFYTGSGFDRGHMVRREDPGWGSTYQEAKYANDDTFHWPNCCPQHKDLNRKIWGDLEDYILKEEGGDMRSMKISVFTGPILNPEDRAMNGIQVPMSFYKIVAWKDDKKQLKATAFRMKQPKKIEDLSWDESIDFSQDYKTYQLSIKEVEKLTDLSFGPLKGVDTYGGKEIEVTEMKKITL